MSYELVPYNESYKDLVSFVKQNTTLTSVDFEGSGVSTILKILNKHYHRDMLLSIFIQNEMNLHNSKLMSTLINAALAKGVNIPSVKSASVLLTVNVIINQGADEFNSTSITLGKGAYTNSINVNNDARLFTTINDTVLYETGFTDEGHKIFSNVVTFYEGSLTNYAFLYERQNQRLIVKNYTFDSTNTVGFVYRAGDLVNVLTNVNQTSSNVLIPNKPVFKVINHAADIMEFVIAPNIVLPDDKIVFELIKTTGESGNGAKVFNSVNNHNINPLSIFKIEVINTDSQISSGGSNFLTMNDLRTMILNETISQNRIVTKEDAENLIKSTWSNLNDISVWDGNYETVKKPNTIMVSAKNKNIPIISKSVSHAISLLLSKKAINGLNVTFVSPKPINTNLTATLYISKVTSSLSDFEIKNIALNAIKNTFITDCSVFNGMVDYAMLNATVKSSLDMVQNIRFSATFTTSLNSYTFKFDNDISSLTINNVLYGIYECKVVSIDNSLFLYSNNKLLLNEPVGFINGDYFEINNLNIKLTATTSVDLNSNSFSVKVKRNHYLQLNDIKLEVQYV